MPQQPLADAEGAKRSRIIVLLKSYGGLSYVSHSFSDVFFFIFYLLDCSSPIVNLSLLVLNIFDKCFSARMHKDFIG